MTKFCPACGEELVDNANFCKSCGANLNSNAPRAEVPERQVVEKSYTIHILAAYALALLIPLLGIILAIYLMTRNDSESAKRHGKYALIVSAVVMLFSFINVLRIF